VLNGRAKYNNGICRVAECHHVHGLSPDPLPDHLRRIFEELKYIEQPTFVPAPKYVFPDKNTFPFVSFPYLFIEPGDTLFTRSNKNQAWESSTIIDMDRDTIYFGLFPHLKYAKPDLVNAGGYMVGVSLADPNNPSQTKIFQVPVEYFMARRNVEKSKELMQNLSKEAYGWYKEIDCLKAKKANKASADTPLAYSELTENLRKVIGKGQDKEFRHLALLPALYVEVEDSMKVIDFKCPICQDTVFEDMNEFLGLYELPPSPESLEHCWPPPKKDCQAMFDTILNHCTEAGHADLW
jgi:hypothetical protein